ncbi:MAG: hypothetical protein ABH871_01515 [Pseudomonadota bacterium]
MAITPYHLKLKKVSKRHQQLLDAIYSYLPKAHVREHLLGGICAAVERHLGDGFSLKLAAVNHESYSSFLAKLPKHALVIVIGLMPQHSKLLCEIDLTLAMMAVERMLGGHVETMPEPRALSETEQGILQYLLLQLLAQIHRACGMDARVHFRFERFAFGSDAIAPLANSDTDVAALVFRATLGRHSGFVRLIFTDPFVEEGLLNVQAPDEERPLERQYAREQMTRFDYIKVPLWAEAGRTTLTGADLKQLEEGDVVLFEQGDLKLSEGLAGKSILRIGDGAWGGLDATLTLEPKRARCKITDIHKGV